MLLKIIEDVNIALDAESYFSALSLVLTIPDICGKAEYPKKRTTRRYIDWFNEYIAKYEQCPCEHCKKVQMPYLSGEVINSLRNSFLHQGTPNIDNHRVKDNKIDVFEIVIESKKEIEIYSDTSSIINGNIRTYRVNLRRLCQIICSTAKGYYKENSDKFNFFNYSIIDWDVEVKKLRNNQ